jgi:hypothetical protein
VQAAQQVQVPKVLGMTPSEYSGSAPAANVLHLNPLPERR